MVPQRRRIVELEQESGDAEPVEGDDAAGVLVPPGDAVCLGELVLGGLGYRHRRDTDGRGQGFAQRFGRTATSNARQVGT